MSAGQIARFTCPYQLDQGGAVLWRKNSHQKIKPGTDITYDFEMTACSATYPNKPEPKPEPVQNEKCIYIVSAGIKQNLALTVDDHDKYEGYKGYVPLGIYDVHVAQWEGDDSKNMY